jgi:hypothetical protein
MKTALLIILALLALSTGAAQNEARRNCNGQGGVPVWASEYRCEP